MGSFASGDGIGTFSPASGTGNGPFGTEIDPRRTVFPAGFQHARAGKPSPDGDFRSRYGRVFGTVSGPIRSVGLAVRARYDNRNSGRAQT